MRGHFLTIAVFLLAGAVANVAVAWGCAVWTLRGEFGIGLNEPVDDHPWLRGSDWKLRPEDDDFVWAARREISGFGLQRKAFMLYPRWWVPYRDPDVKPRPLSAATIVVRDRSGWPLRALQGEQWLLKSEDYPDVPARRWFFESRFAIANVRVFNSWKGMMATDNRLLAYLPIWPGFTVNTLFYAAILWVLIPGPFALRRLIRRRHGLCPNCAYDLRHAEHEACPECGVTG